MLLLPHFITADEKLYLSVSEDGETFTRLCPSAVYCPPDGTVRDPSILTRPDGAHYLVHTYPAEGQAFGPTTRFGMARSSDLRGWTPLPPVPTTTLPGVTRSWAPEWFVDDDGPHVLLALSTDSGESFGMYEMHPTAEDLSTWSVPQLLTGLPGNCIDATCLVVDGAYHLFVKNETTKHVEHGVATTLTGPYVMVGTGDWAGWGSDVEGPSVIRFGQGWRIYLDAYTQGRYDFSDGSADFREWTSRRPVKASPVMPRHGSVMSWGPRP